MILPLVVHGSEDQSDAHPREVQAREILAKIQDGEPVEYDHVVVRGDLDLSKSDLPERYVPRTTYEIDRLGLSETPKVINSSIRINDSAFDGFVDFSNAYFNATTIDFSGSNFSKYADFHGATFIDYADFQQALFRDFADFQGTTFSGYADFDAAKFRGNAELSGAEFSGYASFIGAEFNGYAEFSDALFPGDAIFESVTFREDAYFGGTSFGGYASFNEAAFRGYVGFENALFSRYADFDAARFSEEVYFSGAEFNGFASFSDATFSKYAEFSAATFNGDVGFGGATFRGEVYFNEATFRGYFFGWNDIKSTLTCDEATYLGLIQNFRNHSQFDDANDCCRIYRYRNMENLTENCTILEDIFENQEYSGAYDEA